MVVFNSSVNFYVFWFKQRLMKNNLMRINTTYSGKHSTVRRGKNSNDIQMTTVETKCENANLLTGAS